MRTILENGLLLLPDRTVAEGDILIESGEIAVGKCADFCVVDLHRPHLTPCVDAANLVVYSVHASDVVMTLVDGAVVYDNGLWNNINHERAEFDFRCATRRLGFKR